MVNCCLNQVFQNHLMFRIGDNWSLSGAPFSCLPGAGQSLSFYSVCLSTMSWRGRHCVRRRARRTLLPPSHSGGRRRAGAEKQSPLQPRGVRCTPVRKPIGQHETPVATATFLTAPERRKRTTGAPGRAPLPLWLITAPEGRSSKGYSYQPEPMSSPSWRTAQACLVSSSPVAGLTKT